jgi:hypothetical protein
MKKLLLLLALIPTLAMAGHKSYVPGSRDGHYVGGSAGSSHKGDHYVNPNTGDHYRDRAHGVPY